MIQIYNTFPRGLQKGGEALTLQLCITTLFVIMYLNIFCWYQLQNITYCGPSKTFFCMVVVTISQ